MRFPKQAAVAAVAIAVFAACGGSSAPTTGAVGPTPAGQATNAPTAAAAPTAGAATPAAPAGGATLSPADWATKLCGLLTPADLKTATGDDYGAGVPDAYGLCTFEVGGGSTNTGKGQVVAAVQYLTLSYVKSSFGGGGSDASVSGHAAFWNPTSGLQSMWVDVGGGALLVLSFDPVTNDSQAAAQAIATVIVGKM